MNTTVYHFKYNIIYLLYDRFIQISSLSFSGDSTYLITSSSTETVHVFRVTEPSPEPPEEQVRFQCFPQRVVESTTLNNICPCDTLRLYCCTYTGVLCTCICAYVDIGVGK